MNKVLSSIQHLHPGIISALVLLLVLALIGPAFGNEPAGLHFIRQTDSLSFVLAYMKNGFTTFSPATLNLSSEEGKAACEFSALYYLSARISALGISPVVVLRALHFILFAVGIHYLVKLWSAFVQHRVTVFFMASLVCSSTVLLYYANNLLPDIPAFGLTLAGLYHGMRALADENQNSLRRSVWFFIPALLFKITYGIYPLAILAAWAFQHRTWSSQRIQTSVKWAIICLLPAATWAIFSNVYNQQHHSDYFLTSWAPLWQLNGEQVADVLDHVSRFWRVNFYYPTTLHLIMLMLVATGALCVFLINRFHLLLLFVILGSLMYVLLFFEKFRDHDYYLLVFIPGIAVLFTVWWQYPFMQRRAGRLAGALVIGMVGTLSFNYASKKIEQRYHRPPDLYSAMGEVFGRQGGARAFAVEEGDRVVVIGDHTMNGSLAFLNVQGITVPGSHLNSAQVDEAIGKYGIRKILVIGDEGAEWNALLEGAHLIHSHGNVKTFVIP